MRPSSRRVLQRAAKLLPSVIFLGAQVARCDPKGAPHRDSNSDKTDELNDEIDDSDDLPILDDRELLQAFEYDDTYGEPEPEDGDFWVEPDEDRDS